MRSGRCSEPPIIFLPSYSQNIPIFILCILGKIPWNSTIDPSSKAMGLRAFWPKPSRGSSSISQISPAVPMEPTTSRLFAFSFMPIAVAWRTYLACPGGLECESTAINIVIYNIVIYNVVIYIYILLHPSISIIS